MKNKIGNDIKFFYLLITALLLSGCSSKNLNTIWNKTQKATIVAAKDPTTWGSALCAGALYATYDDDITDSLMKKNIISSQSDDMLRDLNGLVLYSSALLVEDDDANKRTKRVLVDLSASFASRTITSTLASNIDKDSPNEKHDYSIASHHAIDPFANSALTRKNVDEMSIPTWGKYSINTLSYASAAGSALVRVQEGGHSFADQVLGLSIGNFIGIFFYEAFLEGDETVEVSVSKDSFSLKTTWHF